MYFAVLTGANRSKRIFDVHWHDYRDKSDRSLSTHCLSQAIGSRTQHNQNEQTYIVRFFSSAFLEPSFCSWSARRCHPHIDTDDADSPTVSHFGSPKFPFASKTPGIWFSFFLAPPRSLFDPLKGIWKRTKQQVEPDGNHVDCYSRNFILSSKPLSLLDASRSYLFIFICLSNTQKLSERK